VRGGFPPTSRIFTRSSPPVAGGGGGAPFILATDFTAGPVSGGEDNKGCYLSIYGLNFGTFSDYGTTNFVTIGGVNVDNYRCLEDVKGSPFADIGIQRLTVQVGALTGLSAGTAYPVSVTVGGVDPSNATNSGNYVAPISGDDITFTPQPGSIIFVDPVSGNNANAGTFASPKKDLQSSNGLAGALYYNTTQNGTNGVHPGTHVYLRGGTYTATGLNGRWVDLFRITGTAPTGATDRGPICVTSYPGTAGSNSPEVAAWAGSGGAGGGFNGNDSTRAVETSTSFGGFTGWCQYIQISNLKVAVDATAGGDHGPFNTQCTGKWWRIVNCEGTWPSTATGTQARSAGIEGSPQDGRFLLNYLHDIYGAGSEANTNHGVYMGGHSSGSGNVANRNVFAFNYIADITYGNGFSFFDGVNGSGMTGNIVAHNWIERVNKHGLNIADNCGPLKAFNNIIIDSGEDGIRLSTSTALGTNGICFTNNVVYGWQRVYSAAARYALTNESSYSGSVRAENNIFMQHSGYASSSFDFVSLAGGTYNLVKNRWYDATSVRISKPAADSTGSYGNPSFTAAGTDFTLADGSACIDAGNTPTGITRDFGFELSTTPQGSSHDQGAYERAT